MGKAVRTQLWCIIFLQLYCLSIEGTIYQVVSAGRVSVRPDPQDWRRYQLLWLWFLFCPIILRVRIIPSPTRSPLYGAWAITVITQYLLNRSVWRSSVYAFSFFLPNKAIRYWQTGSQNAILKAVKISGIKGDLTHSARIYSSSLLESFVFHPVSNLLPFTKILI